MSVQVTLDCGIEQVLNLLSDLGSQPEALGTVGAFFRCGDSKQKTVRLRMLVSALVPRSFSEEGRIEMTRG